VPDSSYTAAEVDAALATLVEPGRLAHAQEVVVHAAPTLQRVLAEALAEGGWFGETYDAEVNRVSAQQDEGERARAVSTLVAEQTRLGMFVGVAVGFELAHQLEHLRESGAGESGGGVPGGGELGGGVPGGGESGGGLRGAGESGDGEQGIGEQGAGEQGGWESQTSPTPTEEH
jgi:hypothetical protein